MRLRCRDLSIEAGGALLGRISNEIDFNLRKKSIYQEIDFKSNETTRISNEIRFQFQFLSRGARGALRGLFGGVKVFG